MAIAQIINGVVVLVDKTKNEAEPGWEIVGDNVICGMVDNGDGTFSIPDKTAAELLTEIRERKIEELKNETLRRLMLINREINTWSEVELLHMLWLSIVPAARQPTAEMQSIIDIFVVAKNSYLWLMDAARTYDQISAADPVNDPAWP